MVVSTILFFLSVIITIAIPVGTVIHVKEGEKRLDEENRKKLRAEIEQAKKEYRGR